MIKKRKMKDKKEMKTKEGNKQLSFIKESWERKPVLLVGIMAFALLIGIVLISALTTDFGELNSNIYIGDSYLFNSPSSPNPLQTPSFRMEYKSEGFGEEQNALVSESGYKWLFNYLNGGTIYNG